MNGRTAKKIRKLFLTDPRENSQTRKFYRKIKKNYNTIPHTDKEVFLSNLENTFV